MTTVRAKVHVCRENRSGRYPLVVQLIHCRQRRLISTGIKIAPKLFDETTQRVLYRPHYGVTHNEVRAMNSTLQGILAAVKKRIAEYAGAYFTAEEIAQWYRMRGNDHYLFTYFEKMIANKVAEQKIGISKAYESTVHSLKAFRGSSEILFSEIDFRFLSDYEHFLLSSGVAPNTVAYYLRNLRTAYNRAEAEGVFQPLGASPFRKFKLSGAKTIKRALPIEVIKQLSELDLSAEPRLAVARDLFMASFYLRGVAFVDLVHLKRVNLVGGDVFYSRRKTGTLVVVKIVPALQAIIDRYASDNSYLFPCLSDADTSTEAQYERYRKSLYYYNRYLKRLGELLKIDVPLTGYVARHSWATHAKNKGASTTVISEGLGHASEKITQVYLKSFDSGVLNRLNSVVSELQ